MSCDCGILRVCERVRACTHLWLTAVILFLSPNTPSDFTRASSFIQHVQNTMLQYWRKQTECSGNELSNTQIVDDILIVKLEI